MKMILTLICSIFFAVGALAYNCPRGVNCEISDDYQAFGSMNLDMITHILDGTIWQCGQYGCYGGRSSTIQVGDRTCTLHVDGAYDRWEDRNIAGGFLKAMGENLIPFTVNSCECPCHGPKCMTTHMTPPMIFLGNHTNATKKKDSSRSHVSLPKLYGGETINLTEYYSSAPDHIFHRTRPSRKHFAADGSIYSDNSFYAFPINQTHVTTSYYEYQQIRRNSKSHQKNVFSYFSGCQHPCEPVSWENLNRRFHKRGNFYRDGRYVQWNFECGNDYENICSGLSKIGKVGQTIAQLAGQPAVSTFLGAVLTGLSFC